MSNAPGVLARLFGRENAAPVVSSLALAALNRPLLAHAPMADALINGYLTGTITSADTQLAVDRVPMAAPVATAEQAGTIGVINISGGMVNRPMPGPSGSGPVSYVALRDEFDALMDDESVTAIVLRIESPGGMASGCFDLTDHIYAARGGKPIHALVDDYAYSGGYAIAAACDEIWVSRTGGVGSVGAAGFHADFSGNNAQRGVKVTAMYAGARKIDMNPNFPLSAEAQARGQAQIDSLCNMFIETVARYRGLDAAAVQATESDTYHGQEAIDVGLATKLGGWNELVAALGAPAAPDPEQPGDEDNADEPGVAATAGVVIAENYVLTEELSKALQEPGVIVTSIDTTPTDLQVEVDPATVEEAVAQINLHTSRSRLFAAAQAAGLSAEITVAMVEGVEPDEIVDVDARIAHARQVIDLCAAAQGNADPAAYVRKHTDIQQVRSEIIEAKAKADDAAHVQVTLPANFGRATASSKWGATIKKFGGISQ